MCSSTGGLLGASIFWLLQITVLCTCLYKYLCGSLFSVIRDIYPEVGVLDDMVILFLTFLMNCQWCSTTATLFCTPTRSVQGFQFLHVLPKHVICLLICFAVDILIDIKTGFAFPEWLVIISLQKCLFKSFAHFLIGCLFLLLLNCGTSYIFRIPVAFSDR